MPFRYLLFVVGAAILAAALTVAVAFWLLAGEEWMAPALMAVLATLALLAHRWMRRK